MSIFWWLGLSIPTVMSQLALRTNKFRFKAAVTGSCMALILAVAIVAGLPALRVLPLLAAFGFSILGDAFLSFREGREGFYLYGILGFFCAHALYLANALARPVNPFPAIVLLVILLLPYTFYYRRRLVPHIDGQAMKVAMYAYILISCITFSFVATMDASLPERILLTAGIGLILFSDSCIGENDFGGNHALEGWILPTYYLSHILLTASVLVAAPGI